MKTSSLLRLKTCSRFFDFDIKYYLILINISARRPSKDKYRELEDKRVKLAEEMVPLLFNPSEQLSETLRDSTIFAKAQGLIDI